MKKSVLGIRIDDDLKERLAKRAAQEGVSQTAFVERVLGEALEGAQRTDLLIRNIHEECLQIEDMITLMHGFNIEVYATLLGRTEITYSSKEERADGQRKREKAFTGMKSYIDVAAKKVFAGENAWGGAASPQTEESGS